LTGGFHFEVDWDRLAPTEAENLCLELLTQLGYRKVDWSRETREIDIVAELPKKDPDGYEYKELWLVSISPNREEIPLDILFDDPDYFLRRVLRPGAREDFASAYSGVTLLVVSLNDDDEVRRYFERNVVTDHRRHRLSHGSDYVRTRIWDRTYLTSLVRQFPQIGYKYFSDEARSASKYRKSPEELYSENIRLLDRLALMNAELEEEKNKRASAERDAAWKDISFSAAHKMGNPIFAIETFLKSVRKRVKDRKNDEALAVLDSVDTSVEEAKDIVDQFKSLTRAQEISRARIQLRSILDQACEVAINAGIRCEIDCGNEIEVLADPKRLKECFDELVLNSIKWFDKPDPFIAINVKANSDSAPDTLHVYVLIDYRDNGPGVPLGNKDRIFDAFFTTRTDGTGLGLALVRRIVEGHEGSIREVGRLGVGAEFDIYLPMPNDDKDVTESVIPGLEVLT